MVTGVVGGGAAVLRRRLPAAGELRVRIAGLLVRRVHRRGRGHVGQPLPALREHHVPRPACHGECACARVCVPTGSE